ncbi:hypothetical protein TTHERM_000735239 (macronuclear) [Tetrahymena thermophila SB210]|uniref:Uncharacterized protein n=1 Tax=Tetrahymena thermophila (strain SB210) TaxID=312017 RepID=W7XJK8_TETTS|nr:hypothetical protein TTHERM_000735239 [Tetrahymena thermophila SB210]EWS75621.1 hypothetical protein TTHERM_000735239 [Tetrahymena thermophila SB210]|eukprot:XP_012651840.1 hypothetical protein TTHERM_000735239 [Tetrahymena thermophila SB210]
MWIIKTNQLMINQFEYFQQQQNKRLFLQIDLILVKESHQFERLLFECIFIVFINKFDFFGDEKQSINKQYTCLKMKQINLLLKVYKNRIQKQQVQIGIACLFVCMEIQNKQRKGIIR